MLCHICRAADGLRIDENFQIAPGETGKELNLILDDEAGVYCGLEFWLYLPEGISISKKANGKFIYSKSEAAEDHTFSIAEEADGSYHFLIFETENTLLGSGVFCTLTVEASSSVESGQANGKFKKVVISDAMGRGPEFDEIPFKVTITSPTPAIVPVAIGNTGLATLYYATKALTVPEGIEAYVVTQGDIDSKFDGWTASYTAGSVIPAGEAVVLSGAEGNYEFTEATTTAEPTTGNLLRGYDANTDETATTQPGSDEYRYYMLSTDTEGQNAGFYYANDEGAAFECADHKAYLALPAAIAARCYTLPIDHTTLAIDGLPSFNTQRSTPNVQHSTYSLTGSRQNARPTKKGIYIRNGRKEVVR